jgi:Tfp pilus assembly protein PilF
MMPVDEALGVVSHELGFADGGAGVEVNAATIPPVEPEVEEHATQPPGAEPPAELEDARTMAPPRFQHLQAAVGGPGPQEFSDEEIPTNKMAQMLGRVETQRRAGARAVQESKASQEHIDHGVTRPPKTTQLGLAPVFEVLPQEASGERKTMPAARKRTPPPPPPESRKPKPAAMFQEDPDFEPELARMLEGPTTLLAPALNSHGMPAWIQVLLLVTLLAGVGVFGWQLWVRSGTDAAETAEGDPQAGSEAEGRKGPITGPVNGLEAPENDEAQRPEPSKAIVEAEPEPATEPAPPKAKATKVTKTKPTEDKPAQSRPAAKPQEALPIPTQNLPRDPIKASDVLVHRALRLIRSGQLQLAEATLDRAWELDPKNPQAMAGYATLYVAKKDGARAAKWAKKAVRKRSRRAEYHILYGDALKLEGDTEAARKSWRKALSLDPGNKAARARLARTSAQDAN